MKKYLNKVIVYAAVLVFIAACKDYDPDISTSATSQTFSSSEILDLRGYTLFNDAVEHSGISSEIYDGSERTIFVPTNAAFNAFLAELGATSITDVDAAVVADVLRYHVLPDSLSSASLTASMATLLSGKSVYLSTGTDGSVGLNGKAVVSEADLYNADGIAHGISAVLSVPQDGILDILGGSAEYSNLVTAIERVGLDAVFNGGGSFTLFASKNADLPDFTAMTDAEVTEYLNFQIVSSRTYSVSLPADGLVASRLGTEADDKVQELSIEDGTVNGIAFIADSANVNADNGVVHFMDGGTVETSSTMEDLLGNSANFITTYTDAGIDSAYTDVSVDYSVYAIFSGGPTSGSFATDQDRIDFAQTYTFDGLVDFSALATGTKVQSVNESIFWVQTTTSGVVTLNGEGNLWAAANYAIETYNGFYNVGEGGTVLPTAAPDSTISEILAEKPNYQLIGKAIAIAELTGTVDAEGTTFYALNDAAFTSIFTYDDPADMDTLSFDDENDADVLDSFIDLVNAHTVQGAVEGSMIITAEVPTQTNVAGGEILWGTIAAVPVIITDPKDPTTGTIGLVETDFWASNGVIHSLDGQIEIE